ncbi:MAG: SH3 domain-containing protein [Epulopiscium sp.]|nr:SH3 domain-containing protein [Candidatus Epulonipiscium sp.]
MIKWGRLASITFVLGLFSILNVTNTYAKTTAVSIENNVDVWGNTSQTEEAVTTLNKNDKVEVTGVKGDYYIIALNDGREGYVAKDLLKIASVDGVSTGDHVNIRQKPNTSCAVLGQVNKGDALILTGKSGDWYQVEYNNGEAWIHGDYVKTKEDVFFTEKKGQASSHPLGEEIVEYAKRFIGTPYRYAGTDLSRGVDCSGFTQAVMGNFGIYLSRPSSAQAKDGVTISKQDLQAGDLVFFDTSGSNNGGISHVGIYIGNNKFIHSESSRGVIISSLSEGYYTRTYVKAVRVL